jgi:hypothetical protein
VWEQGAASARNAQAKQAQAADQQLRGVFDAADANPDGLLTKAEMFEGFKKYDYDQAQVRARARTRARSLPALSCLERRAALGSPALRVLGFWLRYVACGLQQS